MDPVGPWSAYASYNRLQQSANDFGHHHVPTTTAAGSGSGSAVPPPPPQLLLQSSHLQSPFNHATAAAAAFLSPPPVGYDAVFSPLFAHHNNPNSKYKQQQQQEAHDYQTPPPASSAASFYEQAQWQNGQLPSPFGVLPHESPAYQQQQQQTPSTRGYQAPPAFPSPTAPPLASKKDQSKQPSVITRAPASHKVLVPNIEEELGFLAEQRAKQSAAAAAQPPVAAPAPAPAHAPAPAPSDKKLNVPVTAPGSSFMGSYIKFLQGERDKSPPPAARAGRKTSWSRKSDPPPANGTSQAQAQAPERKRRADDDDEPRRANAASPSPAPSPDRPKKGGRSTAPRTPDTPAAKKARGVAAAAAASSAPSQPQPAIVAQAPQSHQQYYYPQPDEVMDPLLLPQRRETTYRKAKEKSNLAEFIARHQGLDPTDDPEEPQEYVDSDSDPAWNPTKGDDGDENGVNPSRSKKLKRSRLSTTTVGASRAAAGTSNILSAAAHGAGIDYTDYSSEDENSTAKKLNQQRVIQQAPIHSINPQRSIVEEMPYKSGDFVAVKSELVEAWPAIWRVDGKQLLQKFEPFEQNGKVLYRNVSTYAAWTSESKKMYMSVPTRVRLHNHVEIIVELLRNDIAVQDVAFIEKKVSDTASYQDNFEVYVQTLISHALDPNFLMEIFQERDDYFLTNVKTIDDLTDNMRRRVAAAGTWSRTMEIALSTWPCLSITDVGPSAPLCTSCRASRACRRVELFGNPYNASTLEMCQVDPSIPYEKEMFLCRVCIVRVELYNRISHQKYLMFLECGRRVSDKRNMEPHKDTTVILNELLADEQWLARLFRNVRQSWAEAEALETKYLLETNRPLIQ